MATQKDSSIPGAFDFTKVMAGLEPNKMVEQFTKILQDYKIPGVDTSAIVESSRKNIEALVAANRQTVEGLQSVVSRQGDILREAANETISTIKQLSSGGNPSEVVSKQMALINPALERVLENARELAEMVQKSNTDAFDIIKKRFDESMAEFKSIAKQK